MSTALRRNASIEWASSGLLSGLPAAAHAER